MLVTYQLEEGNTEIVVALCVLYKCRNRVLWVFFLWIHEVSMHTEFETQW